MICFYLENMLVVSTEKSPEPLINLLAVSTPSAQIAVLSVISH